MIDNIKQTVRILYFAPCVLSEGVGGGARLKNMINLLERLDATIVLLSYWTGDRFAVTHRKFNNHLSTTTVLVRGTFPRFIKAFAIMLIVLYGLKHVRKSDVIFTHAPIITSGFPALIVAKIFRKPLIIDFTDVKERITPKRIYRQILKMASAVFVVSRYLEEEATKEGVTNLVYSPGFIDPNVFHRDAKTRERIRNILGIKEREIVIGFAGSFSHVEGVPHLLRAFKNMSNKYKHVKLVIIGGMNVPNSDDVEQLIKDLNLEGRAIIVPLQPYELMPSYLSAFDIGCSPKIDCKENIAASPIKTYEYMSMGMPVVVSDIGQFAHVIENGVDGFLVKPGDEDDLQRALEYIILNPDKAMDIGIKAREKVIQDYSQEAMLGRVSNVLAQVYQTKENAR